MESDVDRRGKLLVLACPLTTVVGENGQDLDNVQSPVKN